jgi:hypothetical protein
VSWPPDNTETHIWEVTDSGWIEIALSVVGLGATDVPPGNRQAFIDLIAPLENPQAAAYMVDKMSTCALTVRGLWRCYGVRHDILYKPYVVGRAVADVVSVARTHSAWFTNGAVIEPGDVVLIGGDSSGPEHVLVCVSVDNEDNLISVDGGQVTKEGKQVIKQVTRKLVKKRSGLFLGQRRVNGICKMGIVESYFDRLILNRTSQT